MFEVVARANVHHQQALNLLKQRAKLHASFVYETERISSLEQSLFSHVYALLDVEKDTLKPQISVLVNALAIVINKQNTVEDIVQHYKSAISSESEPDKDIAKALLLVLSLLPATYMQRECAHLFDQAYLEDVLYRNNDVLDLLVLLDIHWPDEVLQIARQSALAKQFTPSETAAFLMWAPDNISAQELAQGYAHPNISIAKASFIKGLTLDGSSAQNALFNRFAKTTCALEKAELLMLAGLSGDIRWVEPCTVFCQEYPEHTFNVLSCFQHKCFLTMVIQIMTIAQCAECAYQAWLLLTGEELQQTSQLQDVDDIHTQAGDKVIPNHNQAELVRQSLMVQAGNRMLAGQSFDENNVQQQLSGLQGKAVQAALLFAESQTQLTAQAIPLYRSQLSSHQFIQLTQDADSSANKIQQGAEHVT